MLMQDVGTYTSLRGLLDGEKELESDRSFHSNGVPEDDDDSDGESSEKTSFTPERWVFACNDENYLAYNRPCDLGGPCEPGSETIGDWRTFPWAAIFSNYASNAPLTNVFSEQRLEVVMVHWGYVR